jgi:hypothetical protein
MFNKKSTPIGTGNTYSHHFGKSEAGGAKPYFRILTPTIILILILAGLIFHDNLNLNKETNIMARAFAKSGDMRSIPPIDQKAHANTKTATFALG